MICTCQFCQQPFWRFRRDWPPHGYCSWPCSLRPAPTVTVPQLPSVVLVKLQNHHREEHDELTILSWPDCETCESIEQEYNEALNFHYQQTQAALHAAATQRNEATE